MTTDAETRRPTPPTPPPPVVRHGLDIAALATAAKAIHDSLTMQPADLAALNAYSFIHSDRHDQARAALDQLDDDALLRAMHAADLLAVTADSMYRARYVRGQDSTRTAGLRGLAEREAAA